MKYLESIAINNIASVAYPSRTLREKMLTFLLLGLSIFPVIPSHAQTPGITMQVLIHPPYSPYLNQMRQQAIIIFNNPTPRPLTLYLQAKISSGSKYIQTKNNVYSDAIAVPANGSKTLNNVTFNYASFLGANVIDDNLTNTGLNAIYGSGILPEGTYRYCIKVFTRNNNGTYNPFSVNGLPPGEGQCTPFSVFFAQPPLITSPADKAAVNNQTNPVINFAWIPPAHTTPGSSIHYDLYLVKVNDGDDPNADMQNAFAYHSNYYTKIPDIRINNYNFNSKLNSFKLDTGQRYAVMVQAKDAGGKSFFANEGKSQVVTFTTKSNRLPNIPAKDTANNYTGNIPLPPPGGYKTESSGCGTSTGPADKTAVATDITGKNITIDGFVLHVDNATQNKDDSYKGSGSIAWNPVSVASSVKLAVAFSNIFVNKEMEIYKGDVTTSTAPAFTDLEKFATGGENSALKNLSTDNKTQEIENYVSQAAHLIGQLTDQDKIDCPIGLNTAFGGTQTTLAIMGIHFTPTNAGMNVLFNIDLPDAGGWLSLAGAGFCLEPKGFNILNGRLYLPYAHDITFPESNGLTLSFKACTNCTTIASAPDGTYVDWDGDKLDSVVVKADLIFPRSYIIPADKKATQDTAHIGFGFLNWNDWIATGTVNNFEINGLPGFDISTDKGIIYDHSIMRDTSLMVFPKNYPNPPKGAFEGLYVQALTMSLPGDFKLLNNSKTTSPGFGFQNFILDKNGVTTFVSVTNALDLSIGGWRATIDHINIPILMNTPQAGMEMDGKFYLPISDDPLVDTCWLNAGDLSKGIQYNFQITPPAGDYNVKMWMAHFTLDHTSYITVNNNNAEHRFNVSARLDGGITIGADKSNAKFDLLTVQAMEVANYNYDTNKPGFWFYAGTWSSALEKIPELKISSGSKDSKSGNDEKPASSKSSSSSGESGSGAGSKEDTEKQGYANGFSLNIDSLGTYTDYTGITPTPNGVSGTALIGIQLGIKANLGTDKFGIDGAALLKVYGAVKFSTDEVPEVVPVPGHGGDYAAVDLDSAHIDTQIGNLLSLHGGVAFKRNDPTFGTCAKGDLGAIFLGIDVNAAAIFGNTSYNYWGIMASLYSNNGIKFPPGLSLNGILGGFYYNMSENSLDPKKDLSSSPKNPPLVDDIINKLTPKNNAWGFNAGVIAAYLSPKVVTMTVDMNFDFNTNGGVNSIALTGKGHIMTQTPPDGKGVIDIGVNVTLEPNIPNMHGIITGNLNLDPITANVPITFNTGSGGNYLWIGQPAQYNKSLGKTPDGEMNKMVTVTILDLDNGPFSAHLNAYGYFDIGDQLPPGQPYIPDKVRNAKTHDGTPVATGIINDFASLQGAVKYASKTTDDATGTAKNPGFLLGAGIHGDLGIDLKVVGAKGYLDAGIALMLERFDPGDIPDYCKGTDHSFGFNNWYAQGMIYAMAGLELDAFGIDIASVDAGAILSGGVQDPTWAEGALWIDVDLFAVIDFSGDVDFKVGNPCIIVQDPLKNIEMIGDYGPKDKGSDVYVFPYVVTNVPLNKDYPIQVNGGDIRHYRFRIKEFSLSKSKGQSVAVAQSAVNDHEVDLTHTSMLCGKTTFNAHVVCQAQMLQPDGTWGYPVGTNGKPEDVTQDKTFSFTTGPRPGTIEDRNIVSVYPIKGQRYLLKNEFGGQAELATGQSVGYLLDNGKDDCANADNNNNNPGPGANTPIYNKTMKIQQQGTGINTSVLPEERSQQTNMQTHGPNGQNYSVWDTIPNLIRLHTNSSSKAIKMQTNNVNAAKQKNKNILSPNRGVSMTGRFTQYVAKFIPVSGGNALETHFTVNDDVTNIIFPLPETLQTSTSYLLQLWVIPPVSASKKAGTTTNAEGVTSNVSNKVTLSNGKLQANNQQQVNSISVTRHYLSGERTMAQKDTPRLIYSSYFSTSKFKNFKDKIASYGVWNSTKETPFTQGYDERANAYINTMGSYSYYEVLGGDGGDITLFSSNSDAEPFDEFEIKGYQSTCSVSPHWWLNGIPFPPMFSAQIPWNTAWHNDKDADNRYRGFFFKLIPNVTFNSNITHERNGAPYFLVPQNSIYTDNMPYMTAMQAPQQGSMLKSNFSYEHFPLYNTGLTTKDNASNKPNFVFNPNTNAVEPAGNGSTPGADEPKQGILWRRDNYLRKDFRLLQAFSHMYLDDSDRWWFKSLVSLPAKYDDVNVYSVYGKTGTIRMNVGQIKKAIANSSFNNYLNQMKNAQFVPFPPTAGREIKFKYTYPFKQTLPATAAGKFNYEQSTSMIINKNYINFSH